MSRRLGLVNGRVITVDGRSRIEEAVGIEGSRIVAVGSDRDVAGFLGDAATLVDAKRRAVVPGLVDAHAHLDREGLKELLPGFRGARSIDDVLDVVSGLVRDASPGEWIVTMPMGEPPFYDDAAAGLRERRWPERRELDRVAPDNPVYIRAAWGWWHGVPRLISVANSAALRLAGITVGTPPPDLAVTFEQDTDGELTGRIVERAFTPVVELTHFLEPCRFTEEQRVAALRRSVRRYNAAGTTGVFEGHGVADEVMAAYRTLDDAGELSVRAHLVRSVPWRGLEEPRGSTYLDSLAGPVREKPSPFLTIDDVAVQLGPVPLDPVRARTHPYTGWAGHYYDGGLQADDLERLLEELLEHDVRPVSLGVDAVDVFARAASRRSVSGRRWVVGHVGILSRERARRVRELGACVTTHTNRFIFRNGCGFAGGPCTTGRDDGSPPCSARDLAPLRSLLDAGVEVGLGSDNAPVSLFYPVWEAVARRCGTCGRRIGPEEGLTRMEALRAATLGGAYLTFEEDQRGSIEVGKLADLAVLSDDPLTVSEDSLRDITADLTIVGGRVVHDRHRELGCQDAEA